MLPGPDRTKLKILYAEDQRLYAEALSAIIEDWGHVVEVAENGQAAIERLAGNARFDLVITDHDMPLVNGLGLVEALRGMNFPGKVIVYSSRVDGSVADKYRALGVERIVTKHTPLPTLLGVIEALSQESLQSR